MNVDNSDVIPTKDSGRHSKNPTVTRSDNDDKLIQLSRENVTLKKELRKQEDRMKQLATKLVRLVAEKNVHGTRDDIILEDQKLRICELEAQNNALKEKLLVAKEQLGSYTKLIPRIPSKHQPKMKPSRSTTAPGSIGISESGHQHHLIPDQATRLLLEAKGENHTLKQQIKAIQRELEKTQEELSEIKENLKLKEVEHEDELLTLRSQVNSENEVKRKKLSDNIQLIRLQRDSKRTSNWLATYEAQCKTLESNLNNANETVQQLETQLATARQELRDEQTRSLNLLKQVEQNSPHVHQIKELEVQITALQDENRILKQANQTHLTKSAESREKLQKLEAEDNSLRSQVAQLEIAIRKELETKSDLISTLAQEKAKSLSMEQAIDALDKKCIDLTSQLEETKSELKSERAKDKEIVIKEVVVESKEPCQNCQLCENELMEQKLQLIKLREELDKNKNLLRTQISINKQYQKEIDVLSSRLEESEVFLNGRLKEFMKLLETRGDQIALLEKYIDTLGTTTRPNSTPHPQAYIMYDENFHIDSATSPFASPEKVPDEIFQLPDPDIYADP